MKEIKLAEMRQNKFVDLIIAGLPPKEAAKQVYSIGSKMKGAITQEKIDQSATVQASKIMKRLTDENKLRLSQMGSKAASKLESLMDAKKGVYFMGEKIADEDDNATQLGAAKTALEYAGLKPAEKKELQVRTFFDAVAEVIDIDDDGVTDLEVE